MDEVYKHRTHSTVYWHSSTSAGTYFIRDALIGLSTVEARLLLLLHLLLLLEQGGLEIHQLCVCMSVCNDDVIVGI